MATAVRNRHAAQLHVNDIPQTDFLQINTRLAPVRRRQSTPSAQLRARSPRRRRTLRRSRPGHPHLPGPAARRARPAALLPLHPRQPPRRCLARTRPLPGAAPHHRRGRLGGACEFWAFSDLPMPERVAPYAARVLRRLGFRVRLRTGTHDEDERLPARTREAIGVIPSNWYADFPSPSTFFDTFLSCRPASAGGLFCDPTLDRWTRQARVLEATNPAVPTPPGRRSTAAPSTKPPGRRSSTPVPSISSQPASTTTSTTPSGDS